MHVERIRTILLHRITKASKATEAAITKSCKNDAGGPFTEELCKQMDNSSTRECILIEFPLRISWTYSPHN
jgi:hypothetical protein